MTASLGLYPSECDLTTFKETERLTLLNVYWLIRNSQLI